MKKIVTLIFLLCSLIGGVNAQSVKVNLKNGETHIYNASEVESVQFLPQSGTTTLAGEYEATLSVDLPALGMTGLLVKDEKFTLSTTETENVYNIILPAVSYQMNGSVMDLPGITVSGVTMTETNGVYTFSTPFEGTDQAGKSYKGQVEGSISADKKSFTLTEKMQYGTMPFQLVMTYTSK